MKFFKFDNLMEGVSGYIETRLDLFKIEAREELAEILTKAIVGAVLFLLFCFGLLFISAALALFIGHALNKLYLGFLIIGGFYMFVFALIILIKDKTDLKGRIYHYLEKKIKLKEKDGGDQ
ncbi:MAG: phage holin family protein [Cyclobacteriaceae bacterium]|nr:phage holin family protein [Cyclobacteriaceae bacterium]